MPSLEAHKPDTISAVDVDKLMFDGDLEALSKISSITNKDVNEAMREFNQYVADIMEQFAVTRQEAIDKLIATNAPVGIPSQKSSPIEPREGLTMAEQMKSDGLAVEKTKKAKHATPAWDKVTYSSDDLPSVSDLIVSDKLSQKSRSESLDTPEDGEKANRLVAMTERVKSRSEAIKLGFNNPRIGRDEIEHLREITQDMTPEELKKQIAAEYQYPDDMSLKDKPLIDRTRRQAHLLIAMNEESYAETVEKWQDWEKSHLESQEKWSARRENTKKLLENLRDTFRSPEAEKKSELSLAERLSESKWSIAELQVLRAQYRRKLSRLQRSAGEGVDISDKSQQLLDTIIDPFINENSDGKGDIAEFMQFEPSERREFTKAMRLVELERREEKEKAEEKDPAIRKSHRLGSIALSAVGVSRKLAKGIKDANWKASTEAFVQIDRGTSKVANRLNDTVEKHGRKNTLVTIGAVAAGAAVIGVGAYLAFRNGITPVGGSGHGAAAAEAAASHPTLNNVHDNLGFSAHTPSTIHSETLPTPPLVSDNQATADQIHAAFPAGSESSVTEAITGVTIPDLSKFNDWANQKGQVSSGDSIWKFSTEYLTSHGVAHPSAASVDALKDAILSDWKIRGLADSKGLLHAGDIINIK